MKGSEAAELEEYARKYEAIGRQSSRRASTSTTPIIDQLRREPSAANFWSGVEARDGRESVLTTASQVSGRSDSSGDTLDAGGSSSGSSPRGDYVRMRGMRTRPTTKLTFSPGLAPTTELKEETRGRRRSDFFGIPDYRTGEDDGDYCSPQPLEEETSYPSLSKSVPNLVADDKIEVETQEESYQPPSYIYLDPDKKMKVTDNTLKLIQKQAVLDYYERQNKPVSPISKEESKPSSPDGRGPRKFQRSVSQGSLALINRGSEVTLTKRSPSQSSLASSRDCSQFSPQTSDIQVCFEIKEEAKMNHKVSKTKEI